MSLKTPAKVVAATGLTLLLAAILVPTASAQGTPTFQFNFSGLPSEPVTPIEDTVNLEIEYTYKVTLTPAQTAFGLTGQPTATFDIQCTPNEVIISGPRTAIIGLTPGQEVEVTESLNLQLQVSRRAPGLEPITCEVSASASGVGASGQGIPPSDEYGNSFSLTPDYFSLIEAKMNGAKLRQGGPQKQIPFRIDVTNFGNAQTKVIFAIESEPKSGRWQGLLPDPLLLDAPGGNLQQSQATFTVSTHYKNGWNNEEAGYTLTMTPEYSLNSEKKGSPQQLTLVARVRGVYVPSLEPMIMLAAIAGAAMVARMGRSEE